jgi:superfamily II DNA or RNA helicase
MSDLKIKKKNETYLYIDCDRGIAQELSDHFSFFVEGYKYMPKFRAGLFDGKIRLFNLQTSSIYAGLYPDIIEFCKAQNYTHELIDSPAYGLPGSIENVTPDDIKSFADTLDIHSRGEKIEYRDYQLNAIFHALKYKRKTILSPTGSGKSAIQYFIARYLTEQDLKVLIVVPTTQLVHQMYSDFEDYSSEDEWVAKDNVTKIMAGYEKSAKSPITVSTWQSISKLPAPWFNQYDAILIDECHLAKGKEISGILEKATDVSYRLGFTGSLDRSKTNQLVIRGIFGDVIKVSTTKKLMDDGHLTPINIKAIVLKYNKDTKALLAKNKDYKKEVDFLVAHDRRNKFIRNLALSLEGNVLLLYTYVESHGEVLYNMIKEKAGDRKIFFVHGGVDSTERDEIREIMENNNNCILIGSVGTVSTGVNIRQIHHAIFASPTKSAIRVIQSIGRGLRLSKGKKEFVLYDIADALNVSKTKRNFTYGHFIERLSIYTEQQFDYNIVELDIE